MMREFAERDSIVQTWQDSIYGNIQRITNPKKGQFGETLVSKWLEDLGYLSEEHGYDRSQGDDDNYDLLVLVDDTLEKVEVKLASQDVSCKYQFNWIKVEHDIAFIVFLGVDPDALFLAVKTRNEIVDMIENPSRGKTLTPVPPENPTHRKWTVSKRNAGMVEIKTLADIKAIFDQAIEKFIGEKRDK